MRGWPNISTGVKLAFCLLLSTMTPPISTSFLNAPGLLVIAQEASLTFAAAGDFAGFSDTDAGLVSAEAEGVDFFLALGDLKYQSFPTEEEWCDYVKSRFKGPFEIVAGNHEEDDRPDGSILSFAASSCLPDRLGVTGTYGIQYFFDFAGIARIIMISPGLTVDGYSYNFAAASPELAWLNNAIGEAKTGGKWVIVGSHNYCYSETDPTNFCPMRSSLYASLISQKVDLIVNAHAHAYERSIPVTCDPIVAATCLAQTANSAVYTRGTATIQVTQGIGGSALVPLNTNSANIFTKVKAYGAGPTCIPTSPCPESSSALYGYVKYSVTPTYLNGTVYNNDGSHFDTFQINNDPSQPDDRWVYFTFGLVGLAAAVVGTIVFFRKRLLQAFRGGPKSGSGIGNLNM